MNQIPAPSTPIPVRSRSPQALAAAIIRGFFTDPNGQLNLLVPDWTQNQIFYLWVKDRWVQLTPTQMEPLVRRFITHLRYQPPATPGPGRPPSPTIPATSNLVREIISNMGILPTVSLPDGDLPLSLTNPPPLPDLLWAVPFLDCLYDPATDTTVPRTKAFFDTTIIPHTYASTIDATCPVWLSKLDEWSRSEPEWITLLQQWMGYCLVSDRSLHRFLLLIGKPRSGKGTIGRVIRSLVGPSHFIDKSLRNLTDRFGLSGLEQARILSIPEVSKLDTISGETATEILKRIIAQDGIVTERKFEAPLHVTPRSLVMLMSNQMIELPDRSQGLSSKMLALRFERSFLGQEDHRLDQKLRSEIPGILRWALQGTRDLYQSHLLTNPPSSRYLLEVQIREANWVEDFLRTCFAPAPSHFVSNQTLHRRFVRWQQISGVRLPKKPTIRYITTQILNETAWPLERGKSASHTERGIYGMRPLRSLNFEGDTQERRPTHYD